MSENLLIVFVKYPAPGTVKLRLAQHIGAETAAAVYRQIAETVIKNTVPYSAAGYTVEICFSPQDAETLLREWLSDNRLFYPQKGTGLGARMLNAFVCAFESGFKRVILIGSDCPDISRQIILQGFAHLQQKDIVIGPAYDGGYYLIGLRQQREEIFQDIEWGTEKVFQQTCDKIKAAGLSFSLLPTLRDVDRVEDLKYYSFLELSAS
jgi:rSAM/selenodomain-associated transferase 1